MYTYIILLPHSTDNWVTASPFTDNSLTAGQLGFVLGTLDSSSLVNYKQVKGKLVHIDEIQREIDIFKAAGSSSGLNGTFQVGGIGGISESSDFSFTVENITDTVDISKLLGRKVKVVINSFDTSMSDLESTFNNEVMFSGKIWGNTPDRKGVSFTCRGDFSLLKIKELGKVTNFESDVYKSKIYPITYGDFTDAAAFMPIALTKDLKNNYLTDLVLGNRGLASIDEIVCFDTESKMSFKATSVNQNLVKDANNKSISLMEACSTYIHLTQDMTLDNGIDFTHLTMRLFNPYTIAFEFTAIPSPSLVQHSYDRSLGVIWPGSVYKDINNNEYEFIKEKDGYYIFTTWSTRVLPAMSGTLTGLSAPVTLTYIWRSTLRDPEIYFETCGNEPDLIDSKPTRFINSKTNPCIVKIDNELVYVYTPENFSSVVSLIDKYSYTIHYLERGFDGTGITTHAVNNHVIYNMDVNKESRDSKWLVKHLFWNTSISGLTPTMGFPGLNKTLPKVTDINNLSYCHKNNFETPENITELKYATLDFADRQAVVLDLNFPKIGLDGVIRHAHFVGLVDIFEDGEIGNTDCNSVSIIMGGKTMPRDFYAYDAGGTLAFAQYKIKNLKDSFYMEYIPKSVGRFTKDQKDLPNSTNVITTGWDYTKREGIGSTTPIQFLTCSVKNWSETTTLKTGYFNNVINISPYAKRGDVYLYTLKSENDSIDKYNSYDFDGVLQNISDLNATRIGLCFLIYGKLCKIRIGYTGLMIHFYIDPIKTPFYAKGKGIINPAYDILVKTKSLSEPPVNPVGGDSYIVKPIGTGLWLNQNNKYASWRSIAPIGWVFNAPLINDIILVQDENKRYKWSGITWLETGLIQNPVLQIKDILKNELGLTDTNFDSDVVAVAVADRANWKLDFSIFEGIIQFGEFAQKFAQQAGITISETNSGKIRIDSLTPPLRADVLRGIGDADITLDGNLIADWDEAYTPIDHLITDLDVVYRPNYADDSSLKAVKKAVDIPGSSVLLTRSMGIIGEAHKATLELNMIRDDNTANYSANLVLIYNSLPLRKIVVSGTLILRNIEVGTWIYLASNHINQSANKIYKVIKQSIQPGYMDVQPKVELTLLEIPDAESDHVIQEVPIAMSTPWQENITGEGITEIV